MATDPVMRMLLGFYIIFVPPCACKIDHCGKAMATGKEHIFETAYFLYNKYVACNEHANPGQVNYALHAVEIPSSPPTGATAAFKQPVTHTLHSGVAYLISQRRPLGA